jgi:hypothetical protein
MITVSETFGEVLIPFGFAGGAGMVSATGKEGRGQALTYDNF